MAMRLQKAIVLRPLPMAWIVAALVWAVLAQGISPTLAQSPTTSPSPQTLNAQAFLRLAHSSAVLQARAAQLAASRDTRPEVKSFAQRMVEFRREHISKLLTAARERTLAVSPTPEFEHRVILENLEPLDFLALSRRYAEVQVQALEQEVQGYTGGESSPDEWVGAFARDSRPDLQRLLDEARQVRQGVGP